MKKFLTLLTVGIMSILMAFTLTACGGESDDGNGGNTPPAHTHTYTEVTGWFDGCNHFAKTLKCSDEECEATITRPNIQISTAEELNYLSADLNANKQIGNTKIEIMNDITLTDDWTPININNQGFGMTYNLLSGTGSKVTISGLSVPSTATKANAGLFGTVNSSLNITNIGLANVNVNASNYAGGFIGEIDLLYQNAKVRIENCSVSGQIISGGDAGGIYGSGDSSNTGCSVFIDKVDVQATVTASYFAGGVAGSMTKDGTGFNATINNVDFTSTTVTSSQAKSAGKVVGYVGFGGGTLDDETTNDSGVVAKANNVEINRVYGITGWTSASNMSVFNFGAMYTLTYSDAQNQNANTLN